jgi:hypothetical protein
MRSTRRPARPGRRSKGAARDAATALRFAEADDCADDTAAPTVDRPQLGQSLETAASLVIAVGTPITGRPPQSGRIEARTGLRMMPTSPRSPLSFRTAGFPQYGWKDGVSDSAFPTRRSVQACSRHTLTTYWFASVLRASRRIHECPAQCRVGYLPMHRRGGWVIPPPQGSSLESGLCCPGLSSLNRPHPPHSRAHHDFAARRLIRNAFAVRERLGDPRVVPGFR